MGKENVRFYSFLPLAHIYERANIQFVLSLGSAIDSLRPFSVDPS